MVLCVVWMLSLSHCGFSCPGCHPAFILWLLGEAPAQPPGPRVQAKRMNQLLKTIFRFRWLSTSRRCLRWGPPIASTAPWTLGRAKALCLRLVRWPVTCPHPRFYHQRPMTKVCPVFSSSSLKVGRKSYSHTLEFIDLFIDSISRCCRKILPVFSLYHSALCTPIAVDLKGLTDASKGDFAQGEVCHSKHVLCLAN